MGKVLYDSMNVWIDGYICMIRLPSDNKYLNVFRVEGRQPAQLPSPRITPTCRPPHPTIAGVDRSQEQIANPLYASKRRDWGIATQMFAIEGLKRLLETAIA